MTMDAPLMFVRTVCGQIRGRNDWVTQGLLFY